jgi:hypothetical protein
MLWTLLEVVVTLFGDDFIIFGGRQGLCGVVDSSAVLGLDLGVEEGEE